MSIHCKNFFLLKKKKKKKRQIEITMNIAILKYLYDR